MNKQALPQMHTIKQAITRLTLTGWVWLACHPAMAELPTVEFENKSGTASWLGILIEYAKEFGKLFGMMITVLLFLWVAYKAVAKFNECRQGRAEWGELMVLVGVGMFIMIIVGILLQLESSSGVSSKSFSG